MTDYRAELQRLVKAYDEHGGRWPDHHEQALFQAVETARTTLAQPEPGGVGEVKELVDWLNASAREWADLGEYDEGSKCHRAADILTRYARPTIKPVPPEPGVADHVTDDEGTRWDRTTDAALWAKAFCLICPEMASREDVMIGWFANAIMAGCDHQAWKIDAERKPVPVAERLPGAEDCDAEGRCWWFTPRDGNPAPFRSADWSLYAGWRQKFTHWRPHHALPVPGAEVPPMPVPGDAEGLAEVFWGRYAQPEPEGQS
jgi:hypothetical protein